MRKLTLTTAITILSFLSLTAMPSKEREKGSTHNAINLNSQQVLAEYMALKNALVEDNNSKAAKISKKLKNSLTKFNLSNYTAKQQKELRNIIKDAKEQATHIGMSDIDHQRKHFKILSKDIIGMVAITGTKLPLYKQFCPMYDGGSSWLSMSKEIRNPYLGQKMPSCGKIQEKIN